MRKRLSRFSADDAEKRVRAASVDSGLVIFTTHAEERMEQRGLTRPEILKVLRTGYVDDAPLQTFEGEWKCKVTRKLNERVVGVVTVIVESEGTLIVLTVEWEDPR